MKHPTARVGTIKFVEQLYRILNREYFNNSLALEIKFKWVATDSLRNKNAGLSLARTTKLKGSSGALVCLVRILRKKQFQRMLGWILVHEMAHIRLGGGECREWNGKFDKLMFSLAKKGVFQRFW